MDLCYRIKILTLLHVSNVRYNQKKVSKYFLSPRLFFLEELFSFTSHLTVPMALEEGYQCQFLQGEKSFESLLKDHHLTRFLHLQPSGKKCTCKGMQHLNQDTDSVIWTERMTLLSSNYLYSTNSCIRQSVIQKYHVNFCSLVKKFHI